RAVAAGRSFAVRAEPTKPDTFQPSSVVFQFCQLPAPSSCMTELKYAPVLAPVTAMPKRGSPGSGAAASRAGTAIPVGVGDKVDTIGVEDTGVFVGVAVLVALG